MTVALDPPRICGGVAVAALARTERRVRALGGAVALHAEKTPVAILFHDGARTWAQDCAGRSVPLGRIAVMAPGAEAQLAEAWRVAQPGSGPAD
ncbi:hypothetical protein C2I36_01555 [Rhodobacteraceae bacterium WD3A24]|nr:hypothetical protein C2I36_01555 [Rhodobacteraceae bacterium WD3A24]